jgi:hypothetical protein
LLIILNSITKIKKFLIQILKKLIKELFYLPTKFNFSIFYQFYKLQKTQFLLYHSFKVNKLSFLLFTTIFCNEEGPHAPNQI